MSLVDRSEEWTREGEEEDLLLLLASYIVRSILLSNAVVSTFRARWECRRRVCFEQGRYEEAKATHSTRDFPPRVVLPCMYNEFVIPFTFLPLTILIQYPIIFTMNNLFWKHTSWIIHALSNHLAKNPLWLHLHTISFFFLVFFYNNYGYSRSVHANYSTQIV